MGNMNTADLCRLISMSFTGSELRALASELGVSGEIDWERGTQSAARDLLRHFERKRNTGVLLAKLAEARPLVEWPQSLPEAPLPPPAEEAPSPPALAPSPPAALSPALPTKPDPYLAPQASPNWPGLAGGHKSKPPIDPKIAAIAGGIFVFVVAVSGLAFWLGRSGSSSDGAKPANSSELTAVSSASAKASPSGRPRVPSWVVSAAIAKGLANVARNCELPVPTGDEAIDESVISRALALCGRQAAQADPGDNSNDNSANSDISQGAGPQGAGQANSNSNTGNTTNTNNTGAKNTKPVAKGANDPKPVAKGSGDACIDRCNAQHSGCKQQCGKEPAESALYQQYQNCSSRCLISLSSCKRSCP